MALFTINGNPTQSPDDWKQGLADPVRHWKPGYSAWALAHSWEDARGFPPEIRAVLDPAFPGIVIEQGLVEHRISMPGGGHAAQADLFVLARTAAERLCIAVEGKVSESLGPTLGEWHRAATPNRETRLSGILAAIGLPRALAPSIRYQLLHRMASPVIEARKRGTQHAVMLVHSFSPTNAWLSDFAVFLGLYDKTDVQSGVLYRLTTVDGIHMWAAWVRGDPRFLGS